MRRAPVLLVLLAAAAAAVWAAASGPRVGYMQPFSNGTRIDWLKGEVSAVGRVHIYRDLKNPVFHKVTQKAAEEDGYTRLIAAMGEAAMDANTPLSANPDLLARYRKRIENTPAAEVLQDRGSTFLVRLVAPLYGERGLMSVLLPKSEENDKDAPVTTAAYRFDRGGDPPAVRRARQDKPATGLVIDAHELTGADLPSPALLPKVVDTDGRIVYGVDAADPDFARTYGMITYQAPEPPGASEPQPGREGADPIRVAAVGARGSLRGDIVIEPQAADRILKAAADASFLKECRVVVLMPDSPRPPAVEPPGRRPGTRVVPPARPPGR